MLIVPTVVAAITAALAASPAIGIQNGRPSIAVMRFADRGSYGVAEEDLAALRVGLQEMLITELELNPFLQIVDRRRIAPGDQAEQAGLHGEAEIVTAARMGSAVGASYVVLGGFVDLHGDFRIDVRIVNVETGEIVQSERVLQHRDSIYSMVVGLAGGVTRGLNVPGLSRQAMAERESRKVPAEAVRLYSRCLLYGDRGDIDRARELLQQAKQIFPNYREVDGALRRLGR